MSEGHTKERLKELQALPLERKVGFTCARLTEWYQHYDGQVYVSFSGGKDSTVLLHIARILFPDIKAVFVDTGLEYPEIREFVKTWHNVDWIRPELSFKQVLDTYGFPVVSKEVAECIDGARRNPDSLRAYKMGLKTKKIYNMSSLYSHVNYKYLLDAPFKISAECCNVMKKKPAKKYEKETGLHPIIATMTEESQLRKTKWLREGCNAFSNIHPISAPMSFWTEQDVLKYIKLKNISIASVYGDVVVHENVYKTTGCARTGCMFCMFGIMSEKEPNRFQRMYYTHPKQWKYCMDTLGIRDVMSFINKPVEPEHNLLFIPSDPEE